MSAELPMATLGLLASGLANLCVYEDVAVLALPADGESEKATEPALEGRYLRRVRRAR